MSFEVNFSFKKSRWECKSEETNERTNERGVVMISGCIAHQIVIEIRIFHPVILLDVHGIVNWPDF